MRKTIISLLTILTISAIPMSAFADEKINTVNVKINIEEDDYEDLPELELSSKGKTYSVDGYEYTIGLNDEDNEDEIYTGPGASSNTKQNIPKKKTDEPVTCEITLSAEDDHYFNKMGKQDIKVSGLDANCIKASRQDSGKTLVLTVQLPGIKTQVRQVETAEWDENIAKWTEADNAILYEVRLYRDDKTIGKAYQTSSTKFNFAPLMLRPGTYHYTIKGIGIDDTKGQRTESETIYIDEEKSNLFKEKYALKYDLSNPNEGPSTQKTILNGGWQKEGTNYWYRMNDGMFPQATWMKIDGYWYYFDEDGYMVSNTWISWKGNEYYFSDDGKMLTNTITPDGYKVDSSGIKK